MKAGQIVVLVIFGLGSIFAGYMGYNRFVAAPEVTAANIKGQVAAVRRGNLTATVNANGSIVVTRQSKLSFKSAGAIDSIKVKLGDTVKEGDMLSVLDASSIAPLERAVTQARANLNIAKLDLEDALNPYTDIEMATAESAVRDAALALENAKKNLVLVQNSTTVRDAAFTLENAKKSIVVVQNSAAVSKDVRTLENIKSYYEDTYGRTLERYNRGAASKDDLDRDLGNLVTARENLEAARQKADIELANAQNQILQSGENLEAAKQKYDIDLAKAQNQVLQAEDTLKKAQADLDKKKAGPDQRAVERAQNRVSINQASLDEAIERYKGATIVAPFDGMVAAIGANVGEQINPNTAVITLVDPQKMRIDVQVAESDISQIKVGQRANITIDALSGRTFSARVDAISADAKVVSGVATYLVYLSIDPSPDIKQGMTTNANIVYAQRDNVLIVPNRAIKTQGRNRVVDAVLPDGTTETRVIRIGMSNDQSTEVTDGLAEGEQVVIPSTRTATTSGGGIPGVGGGMPPGMFVGPQTIVGPGMLGR